MPAHSKSQPEAAARWGRVSALWLAPIPPHIYALLRIALGGVGFVTLLGLTDVGLFWDPAGLVPVADPLGLKAIVTARNLNVVAGRVLFSATLVSFLLMTVGYKARAATAAALFFSLLQAFWNYLPLSGADAAMRCMLFCLAWADVGAVWSVDAWWSRRAGAPAAARSMTALIGPLMLIRFQIALIYLNSGLWKLLNPLWRDGSALHYILASNAYHRFPAPLPLWADSLLTVATYTTLAWEIAFPLMVLWRRTRIAAVVIGVVIHIGIWISLEIGLFSFVMIAGYAAYLDPASVRELPGRIRGWVGADRTRRYAEAPTT